MKLLKVMMLALLIVPVRICWGWFTQPRYAPNGWYWMYDNVEEGPPFVSPELNSLPEFEDISSAGIKIEPENDIPFTYVMPDSFWFYGIWYEPGDTLYISPDGWLSFDPEAATGHPDPPIVDAPIPIESPPNSYIAGLWQDNDPTRDPGSVDNNRVYYLYDSEIKSLIVEWYKVEASTSGNTYTFEVMLALGGQDRLIEYGDCGVVFSYHFVHLLYDNCSTSWADDNIHDPPLSGIEDYMGHSGVYCDCDRIDGQVFRAGYKRVFKHDVGPEVFLVPEDTVLRWTEINPLVRVGNFGKETESFSVTIDIYDEDEVQVYHDQGHGFQLLPGDAKSFKGDTWIPGEIEQEYRLVAYTDLGRDLCRGNDTLREICIVGCIEEPPPSYYQKVHDITCSDIHVSNTGYVQSGTPVQPYLEAANLGWQPEPGASGFWAILGILGGTDTVYMDSSLIHDNIGCLGDPTDNPDTVTLILPPWTPEGKCSKDGLYYYEMVGIVRLGKVGPDASDHCPTNDTLRREIACLFPHDVGVTEATWPELPDEPPDVYYPGSTITPSCIVENFGYQAVHDVEVRCEVFDVDSGMVLLWHSLQSISFLDWRGNVPGNPHTIQVDFPIYNVLTDRHHQIMEVHTELIGDMCPDNDHEIRHLNSAVEEAEPCPVAFALAVSGTTISETKTIEFAVPRETWVKLDIFDVNGCLVTSIANDIYEAGYHEKTWDGRDVQNRKVAAGIYIVRMEAEEFSSVRKIVLLK